MCRRVIDGIAEEFRHNPNTVYFGEGTGQRGGSYQHTAGLWKEFGGEPTCLVVLIRFELTRDCLLRDSAMTCACFSRPCPSVAVSVSVSVVCRRSDHRHRNLRARLHQRVHGVVCVRCAGRCTFFQSHGIMLALIFTV